MDVGWMDVGWLEKAELKPTQPSLAGAWLSLAIIEKVGLENLGSAKFQGEAPRCLIVWGPFFFSHLFTFL